MEKKFLKRFFAWVGIFLLATAAVVVLFDPFYHYHGPLPMLKAVLCDRDYQVAGTLDHFDYDAIILGTSIAENYNTDQFRDRFGLKAVKAIRASGSNADMLWYLERAYKSHEVKRVFYFYDSLSFESSTEPTFSGMDTDYITNGNPFDDIQYLWNKDVLLKKIPMQIGYSYFFPYDEGEAYSWYQTKTFSQEAIMSRYHPLDRYEEEIPAQEVPEVFYENVELLREKIEAHPETAFDLVFSPASILWWDSAYREGQCARYLYQIWYFVRTLEPYGNVRIFFYQGDESVIANLNYYIDTVHFSEAINREICDRLAAGEGQITPENAEEKLRAMYELVRAFSEEGILQYYPDAVVR